MDSNFLNHYQLSLKKGEMFDYRMTHGISIIIVGFMQKGRMIREVEQ
jgi:hypothetical protein